jgi:hypothetical protein
MIRSAADALSHAGALRFLIPVLAIAGPLLFFFYGLMGITRRKTLVLGRRTDESLILGTQVEGTSAVIYGVLYIVTGVLCTGVLVPIAGVMVGLW